MNWRVTIAVLTLTACSAPPLADPSATLERSTLFLGTQTAAAGALELEGGYGLDADGRWELNVAAKYGLTESTEFGVAAVPHAQSGGAEPAARGAGDLTLALRTRFLEQAGRTPSLALGLATTLPVGAEGIGSERIESGVTLVATRALGSSVMSAELRAALRSSETSALDVDPGLALSLAHTWTPGWVTFVGVDGSAGGAFGNAEAAASTGLAWGLSESAIVDVEARFGLTPGLPEVEFAVSLVLTF